MSFTRLLLMLILISPAAAQSPDPGLRIKTAHIVTGQVLDASGKPASDLRVCAFAGDFDERKPNVEIPCGFSDNAGNFLLNIVQPGKYKIFAERAELGYWTTRIPFFQSPTSVAPELVVSTTVPRSPVTIVLPPKNGFITGKTIDVKTGLPVESVGFILCHAANPQVCRASVAKSADGVFQIPAPHVPFTLRARADGFSEWRGLNGSDTNEINVAGGSSLQINVFLTRQANAIDRAISEVEKRIGVNLPAPVQLSPSDGIVFNFYPRRTKLEWASVEGAVSYSIEIDYCQPVRDRTVCHKPQPLNLPANPPKTGMTGTSYEFFFVGAQPGRWRVWAMDREGREGFKSGWRTFIYLR